MGNFLGRLTRNPNESSNASPKAMNQAEMFVATPVRGGNDKWRSELDAKVRCCFLPCYNDSGFGICHAQILHLHCAACAIATESR